MPTISQRIGLTGAVSDQAKVRVKGYPPATATFDRKTDATHCAQRIDAETREGKYFLNTKAPPLKWVTASPYPNLINWKKQGALLCFLSDKEKHNLITACRAVKTSTSAL